MLHKRAAGLRIKLLIVPRINRLHKGDRACAVIGPRQWKKLPLSIRSAKSLSLFKNLLKVSSL